LCSYHNFKATPKYGTGCTHREGIQILIGWWYESEEKAGLPVIQR